MDLYFIFTYPKNGLNLPTFLADAVLIALAMKMPSDSRWSWVGKDFKYTYILFCNSSFEWITPKNQGAGLPHYLKIGTRKSRWVWCRSDTHMCMYTVSFACTCWCEGVHGNQSSLYICKVNSLNNLLFTGGPILLKCLEGY